MSVGERPSTSAVGCTSNLGRLDVQPTACAQDERIIGRGNRLDVQPTACAQDERIIERGNRLDVQPTACAQDERIIERGNRLDVQPIACAQDERIIGRGRWWGVFVAVLGAALILGLLAAGCGGTTEDAVSGESRDEAVAVTTAAATPAGNDSGQSAVPATAVVTPDVEVPATPVGSPDVVLVDVEATEAPTMLMDVPGTPSVATAPPTIAAADPPSSVITSSVTPAPATPSPVGPTVGVNVGEIAPDFRIVWRVGGGEFFGGLQGGEECGGGVLPGFLVNVLSQAVGTTVGGV